MAKKKETDKTKTNAMRLLEQAGIPFRVETYEFDEEHLSGAHVASQVSLPEDQIFKTLVVRGEKKGIMVFCIPVMMELDLKKAAKISGDKKIEMTHVKELLGLTGYIRGGCSPVGMKKKYPTWFDETAMLYDEIAVSAGVRGAQIIVNPDALKDYVEAAYGDVT
ncbi:Cys-tRNA(Pro) deacylase [Frisingicoccus sp.]|uniref:Cys-tRNA(Pro) deacylase n=1 Tax=Frisingicoccus sp. TaxID=1918627 RepID=UPI0025BA7EFC|nr:Cys-tRNA(Pro) deacylase [Frisingicoccus sp.]MDD6232671.1 Cys-tRNA(Pro) deacylase [Frisingicoccus sp.]MDY4834769.1 Cys-tRNA(Pro) deacylase [Frisingicoccus sp.]MDY4922710.1 Cys-tRNA(Pro) deacylase [Frisingicoccus sp.]MDY5955933.1 Cys-tRNA(Pro) deacylase [Frisingicoccus sp.]